MVWALPRSLATTEGIISLFSLPPGTKMFQFPGLALTTMRKWLFFKQPGCPIRKSSDQRLFAPTRSLSQLITSFIASVSLGIHHTPLLTFFCSRLIYYQHYNNNQYRRGVAHTFSCQVKSFSLGLVASRHLISKFELSLLYSFACVNMSKIASINLTLSDLKSPGDTECGE